MLDPKQTGELTKAEIAICQGKLETARSEINENRGTIRQELDVHNWASPCTEDTAAYTGSGIDRLAEYKANQSSKKSRLIVAALDAIAAGDGSYGTCVHCEEGISRARLNAVPWAKYCIRCQERVDRHGEDVEDLTGELAHAA